VRAFTNHIFFLNLINDFFLSSLINDAQGPCTLAFPPPLSVSHPYKLTYTPTAAAHHGNSSGGHAGAWIFGSLLLLVLAAVGAAYGYHQRHGNFPAIPWLGGGGGGAYSSIPPAGGGPPQPAYQAATASSSSAAAGTGSQQPPRR
jgi:hypothetical protein